MAIDLAWASNPSALAKLIAGDAIFLKLSRLQSTIVVRLRKSKTDNADENFAVPDVGSIWLEPVI